MQRCCAPSWRTIKNSCAARLPQARRLAIVLAVFTSFHLVSGVAKAQFPIGPPPSPPPVIESFFAMEIGPNEWCVEGRISNFNGQAVEIYFGGLLDGCSVAVWPDGSFGYGFALPSGTSGYVTATAVNAQGVASDEAEAFIFSS